MSATTSEKSLTLVTTTKALPARENIFPISFLFAKDAVNTCVDMSPFVVRVHTSRQVGKVTFAEVYDYSTVRLLQCVFQGKVQLQQGSVLKIRGELCASPGAEQSIEFKVSDFEVVGAIRDLAGYPLAGKSKVTRELLRQIPHLRFRTRLFTSIGLIKQQVYRSLHESFAFLGIGEVQPVIITGNECEDGAHPFKVTTLQLVGTADMDMEEYRRDADFFKKWVYLTVSGQLHLEAAVLGLMKDGYCMTPAFRAEPSKTALHAAEFPMPEWELISGQLSDNIRVATHLVKAIVEDLLQHHSPELDYLQEYIKTEQDIYPDTLKERLTRYRDAPFVVTTHYQCVKRMLEDQEAGKVSFEEQPGYDADFSKQHEHYITQMYGDVPVFVRYYPKAIKAFYMPVIETREDDVPRVDCFDMLFPYIGEVVGGSTRIHDETELVERMTELGMDLKELDWYIDLRKYGTMPHGGAGLGLSRLMMVLTGIKNIRDMMDFPRTYKSACFA